MFKHVKKMKEAPIIAPPQKIAQTITKVESEQKEGLAVLREYLRLPIITFGTETCRRW